MIPHAEVCRVGVAWMAGVARRGVEGARTSGGGRSKKHVFIEVECLPEETDAVQNALAIILQRDGRISATCF
jgi:hypothetical protein